MSPAHYRTIQAFQTCTYMPESWDKRFVRALFSLGEYDLLTPRQIEQVERMAVKYRRQLARFGFVVPNEVLEPYYDRQRNKPTPDSVRLHWVKDRL